MRLSIFAALLVSLFIHGYTASAQVPQIISYQGRVAVSGINFNGTAQFKFAFVSSDGSTTWWSNDGSSANGNQPSASVNIGVTNGLFSVGFGDPGFGMTPISPAIFANNDVRLRIWFNDGVHGTQLLSPDQPFTTSGYAMMSANSAVAASVANGAITGAMLGPNTVAAGNLAPGAAAANLQSSGQSGVPIGGMIMSTNPSSANLIAAGYVNAGQFGSLTNGGGGSGTNDNWQNPVPASAPSARTDHTAIWTGSKMIVWGGYNGTSYLNTGGIYDPAGNSWSPTAVNSSIAGRDYQVALWTGSEMLIWGGYLGGTNYTNDGWRFNTTANSWTAMTANGAPSGRDVPAAVWTGTEMIIWGGYNSGVNGGGAYLFDGARYNPSSNVWRTMNPSGAPPARQFPAAVWDGTEMIMWGGYGDQNYMNDGWRYNPATDTWTAISTNGAPRARFLHSVVWTGSQMIVWGGINASGCLNDGGCYSPASDTWTPITISSAPIGRKFHSAVWTGSAMIVWGGYNNGNLQDGGRYNPAANAWQSITTSGAPAAREDHSAIWTGSQMIVWGGDANGTFFNDLFDYAPGGGGGSGGTQPLYLYLKQ
jgi:N-acetylneuraminic acid mutarotase